MIRFWSLEVKRQSHGKPNVGKGGNFYEQPDSNTLCLKVWANSNPLMTSMSNVAVNWKPEGQTGRP